ncbi:UNKNOWN [Stylonychia lemnae]|uniref:Alkyl transferase n=1 Tax=Stylonychia lemnae TaxID=5949 RepID=A0A078AF56_STYLE|nr:UNKNOWN [Stylonychia lemnae]|eukprot:CDW80456.1 UNKNOWN [Stylonychia lemnae]
MDGNRRFATKNKKEKHEGHSFGLAKLEQAMEWALHLGIKELTVFALSTDNLKRSKVEVDTLMQLCKNAFAKMADNGGFMARNSIQVKILGDLEFLPDDVAEAMRRTEEQTKNFDRARLNVCLCYNSKYEILEAIDRVSDLVAKGELQMENDKINAEDFDKQLYGGFNCKPEILIRTSNEIRLSNFLLYQSDGSQYQFISSLWPDFSIWDFTRVILDYQSVVQ